jgi:hypothetical protein
MSTSIPPNNNTGLYNTTGDVIPVGNTLITNNISATGNVTVDGYIISQGSITTEANFVGDLVGNVTGNVTGNIVLSGGNTEVIYNNNGVTGSSPAFTFDSASNVMSVAGNVTATYVIGDGSQLTNLPAGNYSNANVAAFLPVYAGNILAASIGVNDNLLVSGNIGSLTNISATGNVTGAYIFGNGSQLTGITAGSTYSNANVTSLLASFGSNTISTTGNVSAGYLFGDGSNLTGLPASYGNANVAAYLPTYTGNLVSLTGPVITTSNITGGNLITSGFGGNIVGADYVSAAYFVGDGGLLTNVTATTTYNDSNVATFLAAFGSNTISTSGNISAGNVLLGQLLGAGDVTATGNVTGAYVIGNGSQLSNLTGGNVTGTVANATYATSAGSATTATDAAQANYANTANAVAGGNVTGSVAQANYANTANAIAGGNVTGSVAQANYANTANSVSGSNVSGSVAQANYANTANSVSGANVSGSVAQADYANTANAVAGGNVTGQVANALVAGTVYTAAQPNITSVGTLTSLSVAGKVTSGAVAYANVDGTNGQVLTTYGNGVTFFSTPSGGSYGNANVTTLMADFGSNTISTTGNISAGYFIGNGSQLTGIATSSYGNANVNTLLAAWGSNSLSTTGNVTASYIVGNGSLLTSVAGANVTGTVANATYATSAGSASTATLATFATTANAVAGANVSGTVANATYATSSGTATSATTAGTVTTAAQPNITSVGTLTSLSSSGNITASYFLGNGSQLTGLPATYSDSNVVTLLAAFGSNVVSTTGNVTAGNLILTGNIVDSTGVLQLSSGGNINLVPTSTVAITGAVSATGKVTSGAVAYANTDGTNGQVLTTYGNGITYFSTVSGGSGSPGGANTQLQFNDGGAFAGNAAMTFNNTTGNITLGNTVYNALSVVPGGVVPNNTPTAASTPSRMVIGQGFNGNTNAAYNIVVQSPAGTGTSVRLLQSDVFNTANSIAGQARLGGIAAQNYYILNANIANTVSNSVVNNAQFTAIVGGNTALTNGYTNYSTSQQAVQGITNTVVIGSGNFPNLSAVGNTRVSYVRGQTNTVQLQFGSNIDMAIGTVSSITQTNSSAGVYANIANVAVFASVNTGGANGLSATNQSTNFSHFYIPGDTTSILSSANAGTSILTGNVVRAATNYYAFRNDDDLA